MSPLSVPHFSPIRARIRVLWRILRSVRNEEEKNEEIKTNFFFIFYLFFIYLFFFIPALLALPSSPISS